jgi:hypothetical protein
LANVSGETYPETGELKRER